MCEHRGNKTRFARRRVCTVSSQTVGLPFSTCKCDEMHLRWVFTVQTAVILLKNIFEFTFNKARRFKIIKFRHINLRVPRYIEGPGFDSRPNLFLFASFLFFSSFFTFSFRLVFILGITVLLCFYIQLKIFRFTNFLLYLPLLPSPSRGPSIYVFLVIVSQRFIFIPFPFKSLCI